MNGHPNFTAGRIFVVDDEEPIAQVLQQWLTEA